MTSPRDISPRAVVEACFTLDGTAGLDTVYDLATAVGLDDQPVRLAIRRMEGAGLLRQEGRGRKGHLALTDIGRARERADVRYLAFVSAQDSGERTWDGIWRIFTFSVPEKFRSKRDALRSALVQLGAASLGHGVYVSPFGLRDEVAHIVAPDTVDKYLITAGATFLEGPGLGEPRNVVETLWPAKEIESAYSVLASELEVAGKLPDTATGSERLACALKLAAAFAFALERDPLIPPELRRPDWSPPHVRNAFRRTWGDLQWRLPDFRLFQAYEKAVE